MAFQGRCGATGPRGHPQARGVLARRSAEQAAVFAVELRGAVVADEMPDAGDVTGWATSSDRASCRRMRF